MQGFSFTSQIVDTVGWKPGFDRLQLTILSLTDIAAGSSIPSMEGSFVITGSTFDCANPAYIADFNSDNSTSFGIPDFLSSNQGTTAATNLATYGQTPTVGPLSFVNLPPNASKTFSEDGGSGQAYTGFTGGWFTSGAGLVNGNIMATFIVPTGWNPTANPITFEGPIGFDYGGGHTQNAELLTTTPEPATLVLLVSGLVGLLAYAWRKRK
jgi:hypothetical protein